jgi:hypothetical protein
MIYHMFIIYYLNNCKNNISSNTNNIAIDFLINNSYYIDYNKFILNNNDIAVNYIINHNKVNQLFK